MIVNQAIVKVSLVKRIMQIYGTFKIILMTLYVLKVTSRITMNKPNEEAAMVMNLLIVRVNFIKLIMEICGRIKIIKMTLFV